MILAKPTRALLLGSGLTLALLALCCGGGGSSSVVVSVSPATASVPFGGAQQFTPTVTGSSNTAVNWSVNGVAGGSSTLGTISSSGLYTAPRVAASPPPTSGQVVTVNAGQITAPVNIAVSSLPVSGSLTIAATSQADTSKSAAATLTLTPLSVIAAGVAGMGTVSGAAVAQGTSASLFLAGDGLVPGTSYQITGPNDVQVTQPTANDFCQTRDKPPLPCVNVSISVGAGAKLGPRNIVVTDPSGEMAVFVGGLLIQ